MPDPRAPRIAVIVPCFNDGEIAREAIACLAQQEPTELVVVDDSSTDPATAAALDQFRQQGVRVIRHDVNQGLSAARMTGLRASTAPFAFPLDSDDLLAPGSLTPLADRLAADPGLAAAYADIEEFGTRSRIVRTPPRLEPYRILYRNEYPVASMFRRSILEAAGGWQDVAGLVGYEDWNLWMTLAERGERAEHVGGERIALRRRAHGGRMLADAGRRHRELYGHLRRLHPTLFAQAAANRGKSDLPPAKRYLYPVLYGSRPPMGIWSKVLAARERLRRRRS